jgi:drug/metabolite transporter (DMT)-like permease
MERKDRLDLIGVSAMLGFATLFAFNQIVIKITIEGIQPIFSAALRSLIGLVALFIWIKLRGVPIYMTRGQLWGGVLIGFLFTFEFLCLFLALDITTVSRASVIFYTMPIWLGIIAHFLLPGERLSGIRLVGFLIAICGVAWAFLDRSTGEASLFGDVLALIAALGWAGIALAVRLTPVSEAPAELQLGCQLAISGVVLLILSPLFGPLIRDFQMIHGAALMFQSIVMVIFGFLLWFALMKVYPASDIASFSFLSPVLSVFFGWWILGEEIHAQTVGALILVCIGLVLISRRPKKAA